MSCFLFLLWGSLLDRTTRGKATRTDFVQRPAAFAKEMWPKDSLLYVADFGFTTLEYPTPEKIANAELISLWLYKLASWWDTPDAVYPTPKRIVKVN